MSEPANISADTSEHIIPALPPLENRAVVLRPLAPDDYGLLHRLETTGDLALRWRFRGATPSPEEWVQRTWNGVLAQFLVVGRSQGRPLGLVTCYGPNFQDGYAYLAAARFGAPTRAPAVMLGLALFIDYIFSTWNFCKLYLEVPEFNMPQFASGTGRYYEEEGRLRAHFYTAGRRWDEVILGLYREQWQQNRSRLLGKGQQREFS